MWPQPEQREMELLFVYNADSGPLNAVLDAGHKLISPDTYSCSLCQLTYGAVSERRVWRRFRRSASHHVTFLHRDEYEERYAPLDSYPVVLQSNGKHEVLISTDELNALETAEELIALVSKRTPAIAS